jgi:phage gp36-like protein
MKLIIETNFKKGKDTVESLAVALETDSIVTIAKSKGLEEANKAIDKFVARYTNDLKAKLSEALLK